MSKLPLKLRFQSLNYNLIYNESEESNLTWKGKQQPPNFNKNFLFQDCGSHVRTLKQAES